MYVAQSVEGQTYSNRIRLNIASIMESRGMVGMNGLPSLSQSGLYKFVSGRGDITITRLQMVADDLGVSIFDLLRHPDEVQGAREEN